MMGFSPLNQSADNSISNPAVGADLKGVVEISGTAAGDGFISYELAYAYDAENAMTWFPIAVGSQTVMNGKLGNWDTSTITDGNYALKLTIHYAGKSDSEIVLRPVHVRNYTYEETEKTQQPEEGTPSAVVETDSASQQLQNIVKNSASLGEEDFKNLLITGGAFGFGLVLVIVIYSLIRNKQQH